MKITRKVWEWRALNEALNRFSITLDEDGNEAPRKVPSDLTWAIRRTRQRIAPILTALEEEQSAMLPDFAKKDDDGNPVTETIGPGRVSYQVEDPEAFNQAMTPFLMKDEEVDVYLAPESVVSKLGDISELDLSLIEWLVEGVLEPDPKPTKEDA